MTKKAGTIIFPVYTEEMMEIFYPNLSEEKRRAQLLLSDYEKINSLYGSAAFEARAIRRIVLDEECLTWIKQNNLPYNANSQARYVGTISDEEAVRLWKKNNMDYSIQTMLFPVILFGGDTYIPSDHIHISELLTSKIKEQMCKLFNVETSNVWIFPWLTRAEIWNDTLGFELYEFAENWFRRNRAHFHLPQTTLTQTESQFDMRFLPISVKLTSKAVLTYAELKNEDDFAPMRSEDVELLNIYFESEFPTMHNIYFTSTPCPPEDAITVRNNYTQFVAKQANKAITQKE